MKGIFVFVGIEADYSVGVGTSCNSFSFGSLIFYPL